MTIKTNKVRVGRTTFVYSWSILVHGGNGPRIFIFIHFLDPMRQVFKSVNRSDLGTNRVIGEEAAQEWLQRDETCDRPLGM